MFNEQYYEDIWGTVHRHDYCEFLASQLISKYGKVRFLDIGTGCGYLVKLLNEKGAFAYGLEISQYAVDNSHGNVVLGSVTDIPFKDNSFDVVCSQGLWEYVKEEDIPGALRECQRVGKSQEHNIDALGSVIGEEGFVTAKTHEWWDEKLKIKPNVSSSNNPVYCPYHAISFWKCEYCIGLKKYAPKILIGCPNHEVKEYAFQRWIDRVNELTYSNYEVLVVDNSPTLDFMNRWKDKVPMMRIETNPEWPATKRINLSMEQLRKTFLEGDYDRFFCLESDIIPPVDVIETMLLWGRSSDWISHCYPDRESQTNFIQGIGCSIFTRKLLEQFAFADIDDGYYSDAGLWEKVKFSDCKTMEMWNYVKVGHLKE